MKYNFLKVEPTYTGGGIYVFIGQMADGAWFLADDSNYDARLIDTDVFKADWDEELWWPEWQESHLVADIPTEKSLDFFADMLAWIVANKPNGNYSLHDMKMDAEEVAEIKATNPNGWR